MSQSSILASAQQEFSDADWRAVAAGDQSKKLKFLLSGLTANTTRVATWPDKDGTVAMTSDLSSFTAATQAEQETATSTTVGVTPGRQQFHPSAAKFWAIVSADGATLSASYNLTSRTDTGTGNLLLTIATDFSSADWVHAMGMNGTPSGTGNATRFPYTGTKAAGTIQLLCGRYDTAAAADPNTPWTCVGFGDQ